MATTKLRQVSQDEFRRKIQVGKIIARLHAHVDGEVEMSTTQIQAARILLDKSMSNAPQEADINLFARIEMLSPVQAEKMAKEFLIAALPPSNTL